MLNTKTPTSVGILVSKLALTNAQATMARISVLNGMGTVELGNNFWTSKYLAILPFMTFPSLLSIKNLKSIQRNEEESHFAFFHL